MTKVETTRGRRPIHSWQGDLGTPAARATRRWPAILPHAGIILASVFSATALLWFSNSALYFDTNNVVVGVVRGHQLTASFPPTVFVNSTGIGGVFNPSFVFYGGPLYSILGVINLIPGLRGVRAFAALATLGFLAAYVGTYWLSLEAGLRRRLAHLPALVVLTSAYWSTDLYARGDFAEFMAISSVPLVTAAVIDILREARLRARSLAALFLGLVVFTGSHNLTLVWALLLVGITCISFAAVFLRHIHINFARFGVVALVVAGAVSANAWALLPDLLYGQTTAIAAPYPLSYSGFLDSAHVLFDPFRYVPAQSTTRGLYLQIPFWFLLWALVFAVPVVFFGGQSRQGLRRAYVCCLIMGAAVLGLLMTGAGMTRMPAPWSYIQFPYRLGSYLVFAVAGLVLITLRGLQDADDASAYAGRRPRLRLPALIGLVTVSAISFSLYGWQMVTYFVPKSHGLGTVTADEVYAGDLFQNDFADWSEPIIAVPANRVVNFSLAQVDPNEKSLSRVVDLPPGSQPIKTNIVGGPQLVRIGGGVTRVGRTSLGYAVISRRGHGSGPVRVVIDEVQSAALVLSEWISLLAWLIAAIATLVFAAIKVTHLTVLGRHS